MAFASLSDYIRNKLFEKSKKYQLKLYKHTIIPNYYLITDFYEQACNTLILKIADIDVDLPISDIVKTDFAIYGGSVKLKLVNIEKNNDNIYLFYFYIEKILSNVDYENHYVIYKNNLIFNLCITKQMVIDEYCLEPYISLPISIKKPKLYLENNGNDYFSQLPDDINNIIVGFLLTSDVEYTIKSLRSVNKYWRNKLKFDDYLYTSFSLRYNKSIATNFINIPSHINFLIDYHKEKRIEQIITIADGHFDILFNSEKIIKSYTDNITIYYYPQKTTIKLIPRYELLIINKIIIVKAKVINFCIDYNSSSIIQS